MLKIIKIFIASSITEFCSERNELARFICGINNKFVERGIYCRLMLCENEDQAMPQHERKQDEYNELIKDADAVFVLFFKKAGTYTVEELELARQCFLENGRPKVYTYFKDFDEQTLTDEVRAVYNKIVNEYQHYFGTFEKIETLGIDILRTMFELTTDPRLEVTEENGTVLLGGEPLMRADELDYIKNNRHIAALKERLAGLHEGSLAASEGLYGEALAAETKRVEEELKDCYKKCFDAIASRYAHMSDATEFDLELQLSYNASAAGDYSKVLEILNPVLLEAEALKELGERKLGQKHCLEVTFRKYVLYINALTQERKLESLDKFYKIAVTLIDEYQLYKLDPECLTTWQGYITYLVAQYRIEDAIEMGEGLEEVYFHKELRRRVEYGQLLGLLGTLYSSIHQIEKAEEYLTEAVEFFERTSRDNSVRHINGLADTYVRLAAFYDNQNRPEAEEVCLKAAALYEEDPTVATEEDKARFHAIYTMLGHFYNRNEIPDKAEQCYRRAIAVQQDILANAAHSPLRENFLNAHLTAYINLFTFLVQQNSLQSAKPVMEEAERAFEECKNFDSDIYTANLAVLYTNKGFYYCKQDEEKTAEEYYFKALEILEALNQKSNGLYNPILAQTYSNLALMYQQTDESERMEEAERYYKLSVELTEELMRQNEDAYINNYIVFAANLANLYIQTERPDEAVSLYRDNIARCEALAEKYPERYNMLLALNYTNMSEVLTEIGSDEARMYAEKAVTVYERLLQDNIRKCYMMYARICCVLISALCEDGEEEPDAVCLEHCRKLISYSEQAYELFCGEAEENPANLPAAAFYLAAGCLIYGVSVEDEASMERGRALLEEYRDNPIFDFMCQSSGIDETFLEMLDGDDDGDDNDLDAWTSNLLAGTDNASATPDDLLAALSALLDDSDEGNT